MTEITGIIAFIELVWIKMTLHYLETSKNGRFYKCTSSTVVNNGAKRTYFDDLQEQIKKPPHNNYMVDYSKI